MLTTAPSNTNRADYSQSLQVFALRTCASDVGGVLLAHLLAAGGAGDGDNGSKAVCGVLDKLLLQSALPAGVSPGELLVQVEKTVHRDRESDDTPAH